MCGVQMLTSSDLMLWLQQWFHDARQSSLRGGNLLAPDVTHASRLICQPVVRELEMPLMPSYRKWENPTDKVSLTSRRMRHIW